MRFVNLAILYLHTLNCINYLYLLLVVDNLDNINVCRWGRHLPIYNC